MHVVVELRHVGDQLVAVGGALVRGGRRPVLPRRSLAVRVQRVLRGHPQVLLDAVEAGPLESLGDGVHLAVVDAGVEVAQRLGDGLDALVVRAHLRECGARGVVVARLVGGDELVDLGHELGDLVLDEGGVQVDGLLLLLGIRPSIATASPETTNPERPTPSPIMPGLHTVK